MSQETKEYNKLLDEFKKVCNPNKPQYEPSYLEICDYPGRRTEEICSKLLAFFFDTHNPHDMGTLFIDTLIDVYSEKKECDFTKFQATVSASTEVYTENKNRIDLLLTCDDLVVCIENKIWAYLDNNLDDYYNYTKQNFLNPTTKGLYIILSVREDMKNILTNRIKNGELNYGNNYIVIYYREFLVKLKQNIGKYAITNDAKYYSVLTDWILFLERIGGYMSNFSKEEKEFFINNDKSIQELIEKRNSFLNEKKIKDASKISQIHSELNATTKGGWWIFSRTDLGYSFENKNDINKIGIESGFDINDNFNIQITIWNPKKKSKIVNDYETKLNCIFGKKGAFSKSKWEMKVKILDSNAQSEEIVNALKDVYEKLEQIVNQTIEEK